MHMSIKTNEQSQFNSEDQSMRYLRLIIDMLLIEISL